MEPKKQRAIFFDRDGVILKPIVMDGKPRPPHSITEYKALSGIMPGVKEAVKRAKDAGYLAILISNQPDIAYGVISKGEWQWIQDQVIALMFDDIFICFHRRDDNCDCMKPKPGMLLMAEKKWNIDLPQSFLVGDTKDDVAAAEAAGVTSILVDTLYNAKVTSKNRIQSLVDFTPSVYN